MKKILSAVLALGLLLGLLPLQVFAATPTAMKIVPDDGITVVTGSNGTAKNLYICNPAKMTLQEDGSKQGTLTFRVLDQDGNDITQYITWSSDKAANVRFDDPSKPIATIPDPSNVSSSIRAVITATYQKSGDREFQAAYEMTVVPKINVTHTDLLFVYPDGLILPENGTGASWSMKTKFQPSDYIDYELLDVNVDGDIQFAKLAQGLYWVNGTAYYPGIFKATFTQKNQPDNTSSLTVHVAGVAVETANKTMGSFMLDSGKTEQLTVYTANKDDEFFTCRTGADADVTWSSSNSEVATVDENGLVTAVGVGQAIITAQDNFIGVGQSEGYKGSISVTVKEPGKPIVQSIGINFDGQNHIYTDSAMTSSTRAKTSTYKVGSESLVYAVTYGPFDNTNDTLYLKPQTSQKLLKVMADFDDTAAKLEVLHNGSRVGSAASGEIAEIVPIAGDNRIVVRLTNLDGSGTANEYSFNFYVKPDTNGNANSMPVDLTSPDRKLSTSVTYNGQTEGKAFSRNADGSPKSSSNLHNEDNWVSVVYRDISSVQATLTAGHKVFGHIGYRLEENGPVIKEGVGSVGTDTLTFGDKNEIRLYVVTTSAESYLSARDSGTDPWAVTDKVRTYTYTIQKSRYALSDLGITNITLGATGKISNFSSAADTISGIVNGFSETAELIITAPEGMSLYAPTSASGKPTSSNQLTADEDGNYVFSFATPAKSSLQFYTKYLAVQTEAEYASPIRKNYTISLMQPSANAIDAALLPSALSGYLCMAGMHTNMAGATKAGEDNPVPTNAYSSGTGAERTLFGFNANTFNVEYYDWGFMQGYNYTPDTSAVSLGNFGGYVTYYFEDGIQNNPQNPYGVDFVVYGMANAVINQQAAKRISNAAVYVSENGTDWYELAGSEHYDDAAVWNYTVQYSQGADGTDYTDSLGRSGSLGRKYPFPTAANYPQYTGDYSFTGTLLQGSNGIGDDLSGTAKDAAWGYHGLRDTSTETAYTAANPYKEEDGCGNGFDISWAVDNTGLPVALESVKYVKIMSDNLLTASASAKDDNSPVVSGIVKAQPVMASATDTVSPIKVLVDGKAVNLEAGKMVYPVVPESDSFTVKVEAEENATVYINNAASSERKYNGDFDFEKGIIRIIVQSGNSAPEIIYLQVTSQLTAAKETAIAELRSYKNPADYREAQQKELEQAIADGEAAINAASSAAEVEAALTSAKAALDTIKTDAQLAAEELTAAKSAAISELRSYKNPADYREAQQKELEQAIADGEAAINAASSPDEVAAALASAKAAIDKIKIGSDLKPETPKTGDGNILLLWISVFVSLSAMIAILLRKRKTN